MDNSVSDWPRITIVTPSFNQGAFLQQTIDSVLSQLYPNLQYIIIDGGSSDDSVEVIKRYSRHLSYWCSEPDGGMYGGIAKGFALADGEILGWLNSDDIYLPWALHTVGGVMRAFPSIQWLTSLQPGSLATRGHALTINNLLGVSADAFTDGRYLPSRSRNAYGWIQQESTFWRRSLWDLVDTHSFAQFKVAGDFYLWSIFAAHTIPHGLASPLACFRHHPAQATQLHRELYCREAEGALADLQRSCPSQHNHLREFLVDTKLTAIPLLRRWLRNQFGYSGSTIVPNTHNATDPPWLLKLSTFL